MNYTVIRTPTGREMLIRDVQHQDMYLKSEIVL